MIHKSLTKSFRIGQNHKNSTPFSVIYLLLIFKIVFRIMIFRKILDRDPTKITKMSRKTICSRYLLKNRDFHVLNGFDHTLEAIGAASWKIVIFVAKIVRIDQNHKKWTAFLAIYLVLVVKIVFRIVIFRKNIDEDPTKITKLSRKIDFWSIAAK